MKKLIVFFILSMLLASCKQPEQERFHQVVRELHSLNVTLEQLSVAYDTAKTTMEKEILLDIRKNLTKEADKLVREGDSLRYILLSN